MSDRATKSVDVRRAAALDASSIAALLNDEILHGRAHFGVATEPPEAVLAQWTRWGDRYPWLVGEDAQGRFLGFARAGQWKTREAYDWTVEAGIYIVPDARGLGVGRVLYRRLLGTLRDQGFVTVLAGVTVPNPASERLHESMGMTIAGEIAPAGYKLGQWVTVRYYQAVLRDRQPPAPLKTVSQVWQRPR